MGSTTNPGNRSASSISPSAAFSSLHTPL